MIALLSLTFFAMKFPERLATLRKARGLTQLALSDQVGITSLQVHRYENGTSQPTLDVIRRLAIALGVSSDMLVFDCNFPNSHRTNRPIPTFFQS